MNSLAELARLAGEWQGINLLRLSEHPVKSETTATFKNAAGGTCLCIEYIWSYEGEAQEDTLLIGSRREGGMESVWRDSWHSASEFLVSQGTSEGPGSVRTLGGYAAPPGRDWGWQTHLCAVGEDRFEIVMMNISPDGEQTLAVRMEYRRTDISVAGSV